MERQIYASHTPTMFTVQVREGAAITTHKYVREGLPGKEFWLYAGTN